MRAGTCRVMARPATDERGEVSNSDDVTSAETRWHAERSTMPSLYYCESARGATLVGGPREEPRTNSSNCAYLGVSPEYNLIN